MNDFRGYIHKAGKDYSVTIRGSKKLPINRSTFPVCINKLGIHGALLEITYYILNDSFRTTDLDDDCKNEILSTIGE